MGAWYLLSMSMMCWLSKMEIVHLVISRLACIVFNKPAGDDRVIVHRIAGIYTTTQGESIIRTKGDANPAQFPELTFLLVYTIILAK